MSNYPKQDQEGRVGEYYLKGSREVAYQYLEWQDVSSDNALYPDYQLVQVERIVHNPVLAKELRDKGLPWDKDVVRN